MTVTTVLDCVGVCVCARAWTCVRLFVLSFDRSFDHSFVRACVRACVRVTVFNKCAHFGWLSTHFEEGEKHY